MVKTGLIGDQFSSEWCHFSTTVTLFNQLIHHNDKVKLKKLSSFILNQGCIQSLQTIKLSKKNVKKSGVSYPIFDSQVCVIIYVNFCHGNTAFLFGNGLLQPRPKDLTGATPAKNTQTEQTSECSFPKRLQY